ncbi:MAG: hypothetical protein ACFBWO_14495 [Paracoccaceae bacterium]
MEAPSTDPDEAGSPQAAPPPAVRDDAPPAPDEGQNDAAPPAASQEAGPEDRRQSQMAEIRRMLEELKGSGQGGATTEGDAGGDPAGIGRMAPVAEPSPPPRKPDFHDPLRERLIDPETKARRSNDPDAARTGLMRRHRKRSRRRETADRAGSRGGFLTGLSLMLVVVALVGGVYAFADVLAERFPAAAPALDEYVQTVERAIEAVRLFAERVRERIATTIEEFGGE